MNGSTSIATPYIHRQRTSTGATRLDVLRDGQSLSHLVIVPLHLRVGAAIVRVAGISDVWTEAAHRNQGYGRTLLEATVRHMQRSAAALSLLYGIDDFYPKFGYTTIGPMYHLRITDMADAPPLPPGWGVRPFEHADLPAIQALYARATANAVGAAVRVPGNRVWSLLAQTAQPNSGDACRVVTDERQQVVAYAWRGADLGYVRDFERYGPDTLVLAEVMAAMPAAADAVLTACCAWAAEESARRTPPHRWVYINTPPWTTVATAAAYRTNWLDSQSFRTGGFMARTLNVARLLNALQPELAQRLAAAHMDFSGTLHIRTDAGAATLAIKHDSIAVQRGNTTNASHTIQLPQIVLTRLALGAFPPEDLLARLPTPPNEQVTTLLTHLFPRRDVHLYMPDRP